MAMTKSARIIAGLASPTWLTPAARMTNSSRSVMSFE